MLYHYWMNMPKKRKVKTVDTYYGTSGLVSARQIIDVSGYPVFYPDNSTSKSTKMVIIPKQ